MRSIQHHVWILLLLLPGCSSDKHTQPLPGDRTPPAFVQDLVAANFGSHRVRLIWRAPGDDGLEGHASQYDIRYSETPLTEQTWDSATTVTSPPVPNAAGEWEYYDISDLEDAAYSFALKTADEVPNWSTISNVVSATLADTVPPGRVINLLVSAMTAHSATLTWTAPGNDGRTGRAFAYDIRYSLMSITDEGWDATMRVQDAPTPGAAGMGESVVVPGLDTGEMYYFALKTADDVANWSALSNVASARIEDVVPPGPVTDLVVSSPGEESVTLTWTAPGNDGNIGRAAEYDLRYAVTPLTEGSWIVAVRVAGVPAPGSPGTSESFIVGGLESGKRYDFGLKTRDELMNWSDLSNVATAVPGTHPLVRLTHSRSQWGADRPAWSPDGRTIALAADWKPMPDYPRWQIYLLPAHGVGAVQLTDLSEGANAPCWSPDGAKVAFISFHAVYPQTLQELSVMNAQPDSRRSVLVAGGPQEGLGRPSWSPDGSQIAYTIGTFDPPNPFVSELRIIAATGGTSERVIGGWYIGSPAWSPDGTQIAFSSNRSGNYDIWVVPVGGGDAVQLTNDPASDGGPAWSPDGNWIAFSSDRAGSRDIWLIPSAGGNPTQLTSDPVAGKADPTWSPDGGAIAFTSFPTSPPSDVWVLHLR